MLRLGLVGRVDSAINAVREFKQRQRGRSAGELLVSLAEMILLGAWGSGGAPAKSRRLTLGRDLDGPRTDSWTRFDKRIPTRTHLGLRPLNNLPLMPTRPPARPPPAAPTSEEWCGAIESRNLAS